MGNCNSDLSPEQQEMYDANLVKWCRMYENDVSPLQLTANELKVLFEPFQDMDVDGVGKLNEIKWYRYMTPSVLRPDEAAMPTTSLGQSQSLTQKLEHLGASMRAAGSKLKSTLSGGEMPPELDPDVDPEDPPGGTQQALGGTGSLSPKAGAGAGSGLMSSSKVAPAPGQLNKQASSATVLAARTRRRYARRLFRVFARDGRGECDFGEYVTSCLELLSPLLNSILRFAYLIYDADGSGGLSVGRQSGSEIAPEEIMALTQEIVGTYPPNRTRNRKEVAQLTEDLKMDLKILNAVAAELAALNRQGQGLPGEGGRVVFESEFARFALRNPAVLFPAIRLQSALRARLGGTKLHIEIARRKLKQASLAAGVGLSMARKALDDAVAWGSNLRGHIIRSKYRDNADLVHGAIRALSLGEWDPPEDLPDDERPPDGPLDKDGKPMKVKSSRRKLKKQKSNASIGSEASGAGVDIATAEELAAVRAQFTSAYGPMLAKRRAGPTAASAAGSTLKRHGSSAAR